MTSFKQMLLAATALTMLSGVAMAQENKSAIDQIGDDNAAAIFQLGSGNETGRDGTTTRFQQNGTNNDLEVGQVGDDNAIGVRNGGFDQLGFGNELTVQQQGNGNELIRGTQSSRFVDTVSTSNSANVGQYGDDNVIGALSQGSRAAGAVTNDMEIIQTGGTDGRGNRVSNASQIGTGNGAVILQAGENNRIGTDDAFGRTVSGGVFQGTGSPVAIQNPVPVYSTNAELGVFQFGDDNRIGLIRQTDGANEAGVVQDGNGNVLDALTQNGQNIASLYFEGDDNGGLELTGPAAVSGVVSSTVSQDGAGNIFDLEVLGSSNQFGAVQDGNGNSVGMLTITGDFNELGVSQIGDGNVLALGSVDGTSNLIGVSQTGDGNLATLDIRGANSSSNELSVSQDGTNDADVFIRGSSNEVSLVQDGENLAELTVLGSLNKLSVDQDGENDAAVSINGNRNNTTGFRAYFNDAEELTPGEITQVGTGNEVTLTVGEITNANNNTFAFSQDGNSNVIDGVMNGDRNQALVAQVGVGNVTDFTQSGNMNFLKVSQGQVSAGVQ